MIITRETHPGRAVLVDTGAVVVDVGVELHVATPRHGVPLEDLLDASLEVSPDLVQVVVLLDGLSTLWLGYSHSYVKMQHGYHAACS